jgi:hypothetical protein
VLMPADGMRAAASRNWDSALPLRQLASTLAKDHGNGKVGLVRRHRMTCSEVQFAISARSNRGIRPSLFGYAPPTPRRPEERAKGAPRRMERVTPTEIDTV